MRKRHRGWALAATLAVMMMVPATAGIAATPPEIHSGGYNITTAMSPGGHDVGYGFEAHFSASGDWGPDGPGLGDVAAYVDGVPLALESIEVHGFDGSGWHFTASGSFAGTPILGVYSTEVTDSGGSASFVVGELEDIPQGGPDVTVGVGAMPNVSWEPFLSPYLDTLVEPWAYEFNLEGPDEFYWIFPIEPDQTSVTPDDEGWQPTKPVQLDPGIYHATLHSNHSVAPGFNFEHHVGFEIAASDDGFVTGGGWFESPEGASAWNPDVEGTANFGFNVKTKRDGTTKGSMQFQLQEAGVNFHSTGFDWLVVDGKTAYFQGTGTVNGDEGFRFFTFVNDGSPDSLRMVIWDEHNDPVYDNGEDGIALSGGNLVVHNKKK